MKRLLLVLAFASVLPFVSFAQWGGDPTNKQLNASELKAPSITWEKDSYNFGEIPQGVPVDVVFVFTDRKRHV